MNPAVFPKNKFDTSGKLLINDTDKGLCADLKLVKKKNDKFVYIDLVSNCKNTSGNEMLERIDNLAKTFDFDKICLEDASQISVCNLFIDLGILKILSTGKSWYNSNGYYSDSYASESKENAEFISRRFGEVFSIDQILAQKTNYPTGGREIFSNPDIVYQVLVDITKKPKEELMTTMTVQQVFEKIVSYLKTKNNKVCTQQDKLETMVLFLLVNAIKNNIKHGSKKVCKELSTGKSSKKRSGGSTRRSRPKKNSRRSFRHR